LTLFPTFDSIVRVTLFDIQYSTKFKIICNKISVFRYQFKIDRQILPSPKIYPKKKVAEKRFLSFLPALPKKGKQALSAGNGRQPKAG